jgi:hypothetical protein
MLKSSSILFILLFPNLYFGIANAKSLSQNNGFAKIRFVDNHSDNSKTYLCKLINGNPENLKYEIQNNFANSPENIENKQKIEFEGYINQVTAEKKMKNFKKNRKKATDDLLGNYDVKDEKSLKKIKEKKNTEKKVEIDNSGNFKKYEESGQIHRPNRNLSRHYKITGKRIHNGQTFKKRAGYVNLIIKYKIREGNYINTYVSVVQDYLKDGSNYNLKYHGEGAKRKYYLEFVPFP